MRQPAFLAILAVCLCGFIGTNYYLSYQFELEAKAIEELAAFQSQQDVDRMAFLGEYLLNLKEPEIVTAYKIESDWPNYPQKPIRFRYPTSARLLDRFPVIRGRFVEKTEMREKLASTFVTKKNFTNSPRPCGYIHPDVAYEFERGGKSLVVTLATNCKQMQFIRDDGNSFTQLFDPVYPELKSIIKKSIGVLVP